MQTEVCEIVVAGAGGTAASIAVATAVSLRGSGVKISLLLQPDVDNDIDVFRGGPQGFHTLLGMDEAKLCQQTGGAFSMGTRYCGLAESTDDIFVPLGSHGVTLRLVDFHHYVAKLRAEDGKQNFNDWSAAAAALQAGRFDPSQKGVDPALRVHEFDVYVDSTKYLDVMLAHASGLGVSVIKQKIADVNIETAGILESVTTGDGTIVRGDFFIDCSESRSLVACVAADDEFVDWSSWYSADRLLALLGAAVPQLVNRHDAPTSNPSSTSAPGRYRSHWTGNCVALGPAAATLAPVEFSSLQLGQGSILRLLSMLPRHKHSPALAAEFNRQINVGIDSVRDYQLLRLALTDDGGETGWPDSLQRRIDLFRSRGRVAPRDDEFVSKSNWISSFINFGIWPESYDPLADMIDERRMRADLDRFRGDLQSRA